jgi:methionyl-tRNA synthetase
MGKFYITTAIDYVNGRPHIGHAFEKVVADAIARHRKQKGEDVFFMTGVDENAQKNVQAAEKEGVAVKEFIDRNAGLFLDLCENLNVRYDKFIRTTAKEHEKVVQEILKKIIKKGDIYKDSYEGLYCTGCETYLTEKDLVDGKCPEHNAEPKLLKEEAYFFKLGKYQKELIKFVRGYIVPEQKKNEILSRLKDDLKDVCISRKGAEWGIDFPDDKDYKIWVWIDALINYVSGAKEKWPADLHVIGKGINWFHSVIWPAILMSAGYKLPDKLLVHGYLISQGKKMGKSLGNVIDPLKLLEEYGSDVVRYSLLRCSVFDDSDYSEELLIERNNNELANDLGNLVSRTLTLCEKFFDGKLKKTKDDNLFDGLDLKNVEKYFDSYELHLALGEVWKYIHAANKYVNDKEPWKNEKDRKIVMYNLLEGLRIISILIEPFVPGASEKICKQLGIKVGNLKDVKFGKVSEYNIKKKGVLFKKLENGN